MKIAALVYDFPHAKSCQNLVSLAAAGYKDVTCIAAPKKTLNITPSPTRITPIIYPLHPGKVAKALGYRYLKIDHDSQVMPDILKKFDLGIVMGARILNRSVTSAVPIINMHPGLLPNNRNLDNAKNAILHDLPQGVTTHIIDEFVDRGILIEKRIIDVFQDDTMLDIFLRLQSMESVMMVDAVKKIDQGIKFTKRLGKGNYFKVLTKEQDALIIKKFEDYKTNYKNIVEGFERENIDHVSYV